MLLDNFERMRKMNQKKTISYIVALCLMFPVFMPSTSLATGNFPDTTGHWAERYIARAFDQGFVSGYPGGYFYPDRSVTRAEFVSMINNAFHITGASNDTNFSDVNYPSWYSTDILVATSTTYAGGYSNGTFLPNAPITREEAAVMLSRILPYNKKSGNLKTYSDYKDVDSWATSAIGKLAYKQYMGAYDDGKLHPTDPLTRAQGAKIICDILDNETIITDNTVLEEDGITVSDRIYTNDLSIGSDLTEGSITIENCVILGDFNVSGGGDGTVTLNNTRLPYLYINKSDTPVRIVTKGETFIEKALARKQSTLQVASKNGAGVKELSVAFDADLTLKGDFPKVILTDFSSLTLTSGTIESLLVEKDADDSDIILEGKASVTEATVNAPSHFHGTGSIDLMYVNADDITYETKPTKMTVGTFVDRAISESELYDTLSMGISPSKSSNESLDTDITISFNSSVTLANGSEVTGSNINSFVSLKLTSKTGDDVPFTATINSAKKEITITPDLYLLPNTTYYVLIADQALKNAGDVKNDSKTTYFTTGSSNVKTTFSPVNTATNIATNTAITIVFSEDVLVAGGGEVTASYIPQCVVLKEGGETGTSVPFTGIISSSNIITLTPTNGLSAGTTYYVAVLKDKLKTAEGETPIGSSSATWSTASPAISTLLSTLTIAPTGGSNTLTGFAGATTSYNVEVPYGTSGIDISASAASSAVIQINGFTTSTATNIPLNSQSTTTATVIVSAVGSASTTYTINVTVLGNTALSSMSINGASLLIGSDTYSSTISATATTAAVSITAVDPNATITIGSASGTGSLTTNVSLATGNQTVTFTVKSNTTTKTYTIQFTRLAP